MNEMGEVKAGSGNTQLERPVMGPGLVWMAYVFGWHMCLDGLESFRLFLGVTENCIT